MTTEVVHGIFSIDDRLELLGSWALSSQQKASMTWTVVPKAFYFIPVFDDLSSQQKASMTWTVLPKDFYFIPVFDD